MTGAGAPAGGPGSGSGFGGTPQRSFEERAAAREQMMSNIRDASQQDRRVYVGNLSYDVKWHHLKDFMRQGELSSLQRHYAAWMGLADMQHEITAGEVLFADVLQLPNGMSKVGLYT